MRKFLLKFFSCPNKQVGGFKVFANQLRRGDEFLSDIDHDHIDDNDDVRTGFIINNSTKTVYPITDYVLLAFSEQDVDRNSFINSLDSALEYSPRRYRSTIQENIERIRQCSPEQSGDWNRDEMQYYDRAVETEVQRKAICEKIKKEPLWHIYIERERYLLSDLSLPDCCNVLEIGCGNARTVAWLFQPRKNKCHYIGTDISLKRLILAKMVIPEGDFVQCSALNLPFRDKTFTAVFSFGVLHHLENPLQGAKVCLSKLSKGGYFLIHEPIEKPKKLLPEGKLECVRKILQTYKHSEHDNDINLRNTLRLFEDKKCIVQRVNFNASVLRTVVSRIFALFPKINKSERAWKFLIAADRIFIKLFCFKPNRFGPGCVFVRLKKGCSS